MSDPAAPSSPVLVALAAAGSSLPAALLLALAGFAFSNGFDGLAYGLGLMSGLVIAAVVLAPPLSRAGAGDIQGYLGTRYGAGVAILAGTVLVLAAALLLVADVASASRILASVTGHSRAEFLALLGLAATALLFVSRTRLGTLVGALLFIIVAAGLLLPLFAIAVNAKGHLVPHIEFGEALRDLAGLETRILEEGLADLDTFTQHTRPFTGLDPLNMTALVLTLMAGVACLPHLNSRLARAADVRSVRLAGAWTAFFAMVLLITAPALAAYTKLEIYRAITQGTSLTALPAWLEPASRHDLVRVHGVSLAMLNGVTQALGAGSTDAPGVASYLKAHHPEVADGWTALKPQVRTSLIEASRSALTASGVSDWQLLQDIVLPAAASASSNATGLLTHAALKIEPAALLVILPHVTGHPLLVTIVLAAGALAAAAALSAALAAAIAQGLTARAPAFATPLAVLTVAASVAAAALLEPRDPARLAVSGLAILGASLFPALALGLYARRPNAWTAGASILAGLAITLYYLAGSELFPAAFFETWPSLSNASEAAVRKFESLTAALANAADVSARDAAAAARNAYAGRMGVANWLGIDSASAALFGLPIALAVIALSWLRPRSKGETAG